MAVQTKQDSGTRSEWRLDETGPDPMRPFSIIEKNPDTVLLARAVSWLFGYPECRRPREQLSRPDKGKSTHESHCSIQVRFAGYSAARRDRKTDPAGERSAGSRPCRVSSSWRLACDEGQTLFDPPDDGVVEAVGENVTSFTTGDEVLGWCTGGFAEYTCAEETNFVSRPADLAWEEASALITSAFTALQAVRDRAGVRPGQKVLVNGASGGVGTFTVQIAKAFGAEVTGVCSTRNVETVAGLGADRVIDYTQEDFTRKDDKYDLILDVAGNRSLTEYRRVIKPTGKVLPIGGSPSLWRVFRIFLASLFIKQQEAPFVSTPNHDDLVTLKKLVESGKVHPVLDKVYPLAETAEAYRYIGKGRARAKIAIRITE